VDRRPGEARYERHVACVLLKFRVTRTT